MQQLKQKVILGIDVSAIQTLKKRHRKPTGKYWLKYTRLVCKLTRKMIRGTGDVTVRH